MVERLNIMENAKNSTSESVVINIDTAMPLVSIVIPTLYRPQLLTTALNTAIIQNTTNFTVEIVVADNSAEGTAKKQVDAAREISKFPIKYIAVPVAGVSNARNAARSISEGNFIAYLDDDQEADPNWLLHMMNESQKTGAAVVFSKVVGKSSTVLPNQKARLDFFSRAHNDAPSGLTDKFYGCGASLLNLDLIEDELMVFDPAYNLIGGEDDALFSKIEKAGGTFAWCKEALMYENVPKDRMHKSYIAKRSFGYGQGPSRLCLQKETKSIFGLIRWMIIGVIQMVVFLPLALISWPFESEFHMKTLRKGCEGAGKFFWQSPFRQKFYGQVLADRLKKKLT